MGLALSLDRGKRQTIVARPSGTAPGHELLERIRASVIQSSCDHMRRITHVSVVVQNHFVPVPGKPT